MTFLTRFRKMDILGSQVGLNVAGSSSVKTIFGALLSIIFIALLASGSVILIIPYFDSSNPFVVMTTKEASEYPAIDLYEDQIIPPIFLFDINTQAISQKDFLRYVTPVAYQIIQKFNIVDGVFKTDTTRIQIDIVPCSQVDADLDKKIYGIWNQEKELKEFKNYIGMCLYPKNKEQFLVTGKPRSDIYSTLSIRFLPCSLPSGCVSLEELARIGLNLPQLKKNIISSQKIDPVTVTPILENILPINPQQKTNFKANLRQNFIIDTAGFFSNPSIRANFADFSEYKSSYAYRDISKITCSKTEVESNICVPYTVFEYSSSGSSLTVERSYVGLFETIANIGGLKEILFMVMMLIYSLYNAKVERCYLFNMIFNPKELNLIGLVSSSEKNTGKTEQKDKLEKLKKLSEKNIESCLDIVNIVREINKIRVLTDIFLPEEYQSIIPLISLNYESITDTKENHLEDNLKDRNNIKVAPKKRFYTYQDSLNNIRSEMREKDIRKEQHTENNPRMRTHNHSGTIDKGQVIKAYATPLKVMKNEEIDDKLKFECEFNRRVRRYFSKKLVEHDSLWKGKELGEEIDDLKVDSDPQKVVIEQQDPAPTNNITGNAREEKKIDSSTSNHQLMPLDFEEPSPNERPEIPENKTTRKRINIP